jgi:hypothetical protein
LTEGKIQILKIMTLFDQPDKFDSETLHQILLAALQPHVIWHSDPVLSKKLDCVRF